YALTLVSRSCPPAMACGASSGSTLPPAGLSSFTASSTVEAFAHSNAFIDLPSLRWLLLHQAHEDLVRGDRELAHPDAARVIHRVRDRPDARHVGPLGHPDHRLPRVTVVDDRDQLRHLQRARELVVAEPAVEHDAQLP